MPATTATASETVPLIIFTLGGQPYAIETASVQEVVRMVAITPVPDAPEWIAGMVNVRGRPTVIVDMRVRFGRGNTDRGLATPIIIARTSGDVAIGLIADTIRELAAVPVDAVFPSGAHDGLVTAIARIENDLVSVADVDAVAGGAERLVVATA